MNTTHVISISIAIHPYMVSTDGHPDHSHPWQSLVLATSYPHPTPHQEHKKKFAGFWPTSWTRDMTNHMTKAPAYPLITATITTTHWYWLIHQQKYTYHHHPPSQPLGYTTCHTNQNVTTPCQSEGHQDEEMPNAHHRQNYPAHHAILDPCMQTLQEAWWEDWHQNCQLHCWGHVQAPAC